MMTIDDLITKLETEVFKRKYAPAQHAELVKALERECALADVLAVVRDFVWHHVPGRPIPSPHDVRVKCLEEKAARVRRLERAYAERGKGATAADVLEEIEGRGQSYNYRVYAKAFGMLFKSRTLHILEAHREVVRRAIEIVGPPREDDAFRDFEMSQPPSERLNHLKRVVNEEVAALDFDPFNDAVQT